MCCIESCSSSARELGIQGECSTGYSLFEKAKIGPKTSPQELKLGWKKTGPGKGEPCCTDERDKRGKGQTFLQKTQDILQRLEKHRSLLNTGLDEVKVSRASILRYLACKALAPRGQRDTQMMLEEQLVALEAKRTN